MSLPPVLLVHGFASTFERNWRQNGWVDLLTDEGREVIGTDLPGHGSAEAPTDPAAYADLAGHVEGWLPADGEVDAVGFSLGARTVLELASRRPDRFRRIVVGGAGANVFADGAAPALADAIEAGEDVTGVMGAFVRFAHSPGQSPAALAALMRRPAPPLTAELLGKVTCPVLVVLGDKDFAGPPEPLVDALPNATLKSLRNVDHLGTVTDFTFLDATLKFLA
ncbi:MAG TPA: alpha/beta fold hydrolase [Acidimicrobiales bacterium]|nr:alpha/beta fold hydrolase [Acidimicrobiales bacterium]